MLSFHYKSFPISWIISFQPDTLFSCCCTKCDGKAQSTVGCSRVCRVQVAVLATSQLSGLYSTVRCGARGTVVQKPPSLCLCCICLSVLLQALFYSCISQFSGWYLSVNQLRTTIAILVTSYRDRPIFRTYAFYCQTSSFMRRYIII